MTLRSTDPATGRVLETFEAHDDAAVETILARAASAFAAYRRTSHAQRARWLRAAADLLEAEREVWGRMMTLEMGKPIGAAIAEAEKCASVCRYYADHAERFLAEERIDMGDDGSGYVRFDPIGPVLAIMPWNFPFWQVFRFAAPALAAGNVGLLKHASNVPRCALAIERILRRAGFPDGAFQTLLVGSGAVERIIADPRVRAVTLTGSEGAGRAVAAAAGQAIRKTVLELGGSDPFIVMPSADVLRAASVAAKARTINNGQSCIAAKRFIVHDAVADTFLPAFVRAMEGLTVGDPLDPGTDIGPLATPQILEELDAQVRRSVALGARVLTGGHRLERPGSFYAPTVLTDIPRDAPAWGEELFGPVASVFRVAGIDDAIALANGTDFGLGAAVWTGDEAERRRFIEELEAGLVFVNGMVASDPRLPFGGVKGSGYGRELGPYGLREFVNIKTVRIAP
jgi:succinate-semialdehyde dehydrogenase/glutarate-semialdehyde dehydrogenase